MKILLAIDDAPPSQAAVNAVQNLPLLWEHEIVVLTVVVPRQTALAHRHPIIGAMVRRLIAEERESQANTAWGLLERAATPLREAGAHVTGQVRFGYQVADEILRVAREWQPDLLVIGSRGLNNLKGFLRGSVSQDVVAQAPCPVLVVKTTKGTGKETTLEQQRLSLGRI